MATAYKVIAEASCLVLAVCGRRNSGFDT